MRNIAIIGGGAAGMLAGVMLADKGYTPTIFEKNDKLGKKLFITGKGRCNLTNECEVEDFMKNVVTNSKFLYSAIYGFTQYDAMDFFEKLGLKLKTERGNRVFPLSDHSSDVISVLTKALNDRKVKINLNCNVTDILSKDDETGEYSSQIVGLEYNDNLSKKHTFLCDDIVIATGGMSYKLTGSTGDGYNFAASLGHTVTALRPALVPIEIKEELCRDLMGLSLKNVNVKFITKVKNKDKIVYDGFGEMLFTHFGVSGPLILSASSYIGKYINQDIKLVIDLKPALSYDQLDERILRDFEKNNNKQFRNSLNELLPKSLIPVVIARSGIDQYKKVNEVSREERKELMNQIKEFRLSVKGFRDINEAIITSGGVSVKEINPTNMSSKLVRGLRFAGEVIDVDALTGGFNLQIAWSTAAALE